MTYASEYQVRYSAIDNLITILYYILMTAAMTDAIIGDGIHLLHVRQMSVDSFRQWLIENQPDNAHIVNAMSDSELFTLQQSISA